MRTQELLDVHTPGRFFDGEVHWQMASGHDAIDVSVTASALHQLAPAPVPSYLDVFERNRELLCALAFIKAKKRMDASIRIDSPDLPSRLE